LTFDLVVNRDAILMSDETRKGILSIGYRSPAEFQQPQERSAEEVAVINERRNES